MKKLFRVLAAVMLAACLTIGLSAVVFAACNGDAPYNTIKAGETLVVASDHGINLRSFPDTTRGQILTAIPLNGHVYVMATTLANYPGWIYVTYGDVTGYVYTSDTHGNFFSHMKSADTVKEYDLTKDPNYQYVAKVTASYLNVRSGYYITKPTVGFLSAGQTVEAISNTSNGWVKVRYTTGAKQIIGYVSGNYVTVSKIQRQSGGGSSGGSTNPSYDENTTFSVVVGYIADSKNEDDLVVYASPKTYSTVKAKLDEAEVVFLTAQSKNKLWFQVQYYERGADDEAEDEIYNPSAVLHTGYVKASDVYVYKVFDKLKLSATKVTLDLGKKKTIKVFDKYRFFSDVRMFGVTAKYRSTNKKVARVTNKGVITAKGRGKTQIIATVTIGSGAYKRTRELPPCTVTVI